MLEAVFVEVVERLAMDATVALVAEPAELVFDDPDDLAVADDEAWVPFDAL